MAKYKQRKRNLYEKNSDTYAISRSKIDLFINCPRCFYLDRKLGLAQPSMPGWPLNSAIDYLLKQEFDYYRKLQLPHQLWFNMALMPSLFLIPICRFGEMTFTIMWGLPLRMNKQVS